jgi:hypothetical protein
MNQVHGAREVSDRDTQLANMREKIDATDPKYESKLPAKGTLLRPFGALMC